MSDRFTCQSCDHSKNEVHPKPSKLFSNMQLLMCNTCIASDFEPKHIIILAYLDTKVKKRHNLAKEYIEQRKYYGDTISLAETFVK